MSMTALSGISETRAPESTLRIWTLEAVEDVSRGLGRLGEQGGPEGGGGGKEATVGRVLVRLDGVFGPGQRREGVSCRSLETARRCAALAVVQE